jgi:hypothetical protein
MFKKLTYLFLCFTLFFFVYGCKPKPVIQEITPGSVDFNSIAFIGGNYFAGYQDGALFKQGQQYSIPALLSKQISLMNYLPVKQIWLEDNLSIGLTLKGFTFQNKFLLKNKADCLGEISLKPSNEMIDMAFVSRLRNANSFTNDLSVPFANIQDYFNPEFGLIPSNNNPNPFYHRIASNPGVSTMASDLKKINPGFTAIWVGMEDIYNYAQRGGYNAKILEPALFEKHLDELLSTIVLNNGKGVIANIPDISVFPFFTLIPSLSIDLTKERADSLNRIFDGVFEYRAGKNGFQIEDESLPDFPFRLSQAGEFILLNTPTDSIKCHKMGLFNPLPNRYILDKNEIQFITNHTTSYNEVIKRKALEYDLAYVDVNAYFKSLSNGIIVDGITYTSEFISGGFFSLDGFHPNQKGYALLANKFIESVNQKYGSTIPPINCKQCSGIKFP